MNFASVEKIAAAILYEGYILYPYRPTAMKNRQRWNFGTLYPRVYAEAQRPQEPYRLVVECLVQDWPAAGEGTGLDLKLNFLQLQAPATSSSPLTDPSLAWEEAMERTADWKSLRLGALMASPRALTVQEHGLVIEISIHAEDLGGGVCKLQVTVQNTTPLGSGVAARRDEALGFSFVSAHALLGLSAGTFVSLFDPAPALREAVNDCHSVGCFPVLAGIAPDRTCMLCSPIILYDYPQIAPESDGDFFDSTEMDEMLTLRVLTLTDAEKQEMRNGDPRARKILERTDAVTAEAMLKAHGVIRELRTLREGTP